MVKIFMFILLAAIIYIVGFCMGCAWIFNRNFERDKKNAEGKEKFWRMFRVLNYWMMMRYENKNIVEYLKSKNFVNVAIYGMGYLGKHLVKELGGTEIDINYIIDNKVEYIEEEIKIYKPTNVLPDVDAVIVTAIMDFDEIADELEAKVKCPILSLENIVYEM